MKREYREIRVFESSIGLRPFERWYWRLRDPKARQKVQIVIARLADPNYKGYLSVGGGVCEARIFHGPGYRVYFGFRGTSIVVLLGGGDKGTQNKDINEAKNLWKAYKDETSKYQQKFRS